ncbi:NitT/TauT family transport system permease protein [Tindallia magadiensis]|uniref:NitT/TauT family transport system permease protein n=1 Tax=Tindallia magadiensis TaxID=69895 RepID=A0A1I3ELQ4_9FIRM|nr:ABC transporter permease [Tindallia magadiensis]SFH99750.1 NitT/TauT family transport system permease protein [Tindallia magadiensis]
MKLRTVTPLILPALFLVGWQLLAVHMDNMVVLPPVERVGGILLNPTEPLISLGSLANNVFTSLSRVLIGYFLAALIAVPIGILMGYKPRCHDLFSNFFGIFRPIPPLAWVPLVLAWFGITSLANYMPVQSGFLYLHFRKIQLSMVFIIFLGAFFPMLTSTVYGVQSVPKTLVESAKTLGAKEKDLILKVIIPAAAPSIINGMRTAMGVAWMCLVAAEMLPGSVAGVGYMISHAYSLARTDIVIAGMIAIGLVGALLDYLFRIIERYKFRWLYRSGS